MANSFSVARSQDGGISILSLDGYLDAHTAPHFERTIQEEYDAGRCRMIVDCGKLTYISSAGLGVFMSFVEDVRQSGGDIKLCGLQPTVYEVFEILGFPEIFDILPDQAQAIRKFSEGGAREA